MKKVLAIDYGTKRVGLATGWAGFAEPLKVLTNAGDKRFYDDLLDVIKEVQPELIVVGLSEREMAEQTKAFVADFQQFLEKELGGVPTFDFADETLSSVEVQEKLRQAGHRDLRKGAIDHYAAAQFLQEYLDLHLSTESQ